MEREKIIEEIMTVFMNLKRRMMVDIQAEGNKNCITPSQAHLLFTVLKNNGITLTELANKLGISKSAATQLVDAMVASGFLIRKESKTDRRSHEIIISEQSRKEFKKMKQSGLASLASIFACLSNDELLVYLDLSKKILKQNSKQG